MFADRGTSVKGRECLEGMPYTPAAFTLLIELVMKFAIGRSHRQRLPLTVSAAVAVRVSTLFSSIGRSVCPESVL